MEARPIRPRAEHYFLLKGSPRESALRGLPHRHPAGGREISGFLQADAARMRRLSRPQQGGGKIVARPWVEKRPSLIQSAPGGHRVQVLER